MTARVKELTDRATSPAPKAPSPPLQPASDLRVFLEAFGRLGFSVTTVQDASFEQLRLALLDFGRAASDADMAVLFYAGHGIEVTG